MSNSDIDNEYAYGGYDHYDDTCEGSSYEDNPNCLDDENDATGAYGHECLQDDNENEHDHIKDERDAHQFYKTLDYFRDKDYNLVYHTSDDEEEQDDSMNEYKAHQFYKTLDYFRDKDQNLVYHSSDDEEDGHASSGLETKSTQTSNYTPPPNRVYPAIGGSSINEHSLIASYSKMKIKYQHRTS